MVFQLKLGAVAAAAILVAVATASGAANAGEPDSYPAPSEWSELHDYLEAIENAPAPPVAPAPEPSPAPAPPASPIEPPAGSAEQGEAARPSSLRLPVTGSGSGTRALPWAALLAALTGAALIGTALHGRAVTQ